MFFLSLIAGLPLPLTAIQLLWLNLVTNGIQDKGLAFEAGDENAMQRPPRKPTEGVFNKLMILQIIFSGLFIGVSGFLLWKFLLDQDYSEFHARTLVFMFMVLAENFHVFNCRSEVRSTFTIPFSKNWILIIGVFLAQAIHIIAINIPFMQGVLNSKPVSPGE
jgi:magnesium-transporting ATPase (P-type)